MREHSDAARCRAWSSCARSWVVSCELGREKPDPALFRFAWEQP
ncbi:hypothetical protein [Glycomyces sp. NPDC021274]